MSSLYGKLPKDTYKELLKVAASSLTGALATVESGEGFATPLSISTTELAIGGVKFPTSGAVAGMVLKIGQDGTTASWATPATGGGGVTDYNDLTNKPTLFSGAFADLTGTPTFSDVATSGSYNDLLDQPSLFSGSYADLTNKPSLFSGAYADLTGTPTFADVAFSGDYADLINAPTGSESVAWADVTGKPAVIAAGADAAAARAAIAVASKLETIPEIYNIAQIGSTGTVSANVTIGGTIPDTGGVTWAAGMLRLAQTGANAGSIYEVQANGTSTVKYARNLAADGVSTDFLRIANLLYGLGRSYFIVTKGGTHSVIQGWAVDTSSLQHRYSSGTMTSTSNAVNEAMAPFTSAKTVYPHFTHSSLGLNTPVTLGAPIPGTVGDTFQGDWTEFMSLNFGGTMGNTYKLNTAGTAWVLQSEMPDNSYRLAICNPIAADSGYNTFGGVMMIRRSGSTRELVYYAPNATILKTGSASNSYDYVQDYVQDLSQNVIGDTATLNTTSKVVVGALNELKVLADASTPFKSNYLGVGAGGTTTVIPSFKGDLLRVGDPSYSGPTTLITNVAGTTFPEGFYFDIQVAGNPSHTIEFNPNGTEKVVTWPTETTQSKIFYYGETARIFWGGGTTWFYTYLERPAAVTPLTGIAVVTVLNNASTYTATSGSPITSGTRPVVWANGMSVLSLHDGALYNFNAAGSNFGVGVAMDTNTSKLYNVALDSPNGWASGTIWVNKNTNGEITHNAQTGAYAVKASNVWMNNQNVEDLIGDFDVIDWQSGSSLTEAIDEVYDMASIPKAPLLKAKTIGSPYSVLTTDHGYHMKVYTNSVTAATASTAQGAANYPDGFWFAVTHQGMSHTSTWTFDPFSTEGVTNQSTGEVGTTLVVYPGETYYVYKVNASEWYAFGGTNIQQSRADSISQTMVNNSATLTLDGPHRGSYYTLTTGGQNYTGWTLPTLRSSTAWSCAILITQGATARTIAWPAAFKWEGGSAPTVTAVAGAKDLLTLTTFDGGTTYQASLSKGRA